MQCSLRMVLCDSAARWNFFFSFLNVALCGVGGGLQRAIGRLMRHPNVALHDGR
jgi:hypothetical protein